MYFFNKSDEILHNLVTNFTITFIPLFISDWNKIEMKIFTARL